MEKVEKLKAERDEKEALLRDLLEKVRVEISFASLFGPHAQ